MCIKWSNESINQCLLDIGCDSETIEKIMMNLQSGNVEQGLNVLKDHRKNLLDSLHKDQKCIDCLDYLVYQVKKQSGE